LSLRCEAWAKHSQIKDILEFISIGGNASPLLISTGAIVYLGFLLTEISLIKSGAMRRFF